MNRVSVPPRPAALATAHLWLIVAVRLVLNSTYRIVYPLLPFLAERFEISPATASLIVTVQVICGLLSLAGGALADRIGERATMAVGLSGYVLGCILCALSPSFGMFLLGYTCIGLGTTFYLPALQSYVSQHTPFQQRGRAMGIIELSWALAGIAGVPLLTWLVKAQGGLSLAFLLLAVGTLLGLLATLLLLPNTSGHTARSTATAPLRLLLRPSVVATLAFGGLLMGGQELLFIVQSSWQEQYFGLDTAARGRLFSLLGLGELVASLSVALLTDRLGVRRALLIGAGATALTYVALPLTLGSTALYSSGLFALILCFEFTIVTLIPLVSEVAPDARGTTIALARTSSDIGKGLGSLLGVPLWAALGPWANAAVAATLLLGAASLLQRASLAQPEPHER